MGRQAYFTRLALGRSAFEPLVQEAQPNISTDSDTIPTLPNRPACSESSRHVQQHDKRGYPENSTSKRLARQSRRALNDVLAAVGVCVGVNSEGQPKAFPKNGFRESHLDESNIKVIMLENEAGYFLSSTGLGLFFTTQMWTIGLRNRLQTFQFYSRVPLIHVIKAEWKLLGLGSLFAGGPSAVIYQLLGIGKEWAITSIFNLCACPILFAIKSRKRREWLRHLLIAAENTLKVLSLALITPFQVYATLQCLGLVPVSLLLPWPRLFLSILNHTTGAGSRPGSPTLRSPWSAFTSFALSPMFGLCVSTYFRPKISAKIFKYIRAALPKPSRPDAYSLKGGEAEDLGPANVPGLIDGQEHNFESSSLKEEMARDLQFIGRSAQILYDDVLWFFGPKTQIQPLRIRKRRHRLAESAMEGDDTSDGSQAADERVVEPSTAEIVRPSVPLSSGLQIDSIASNRLSNSTGFRVPDSPDSEMQEDSEIASNFTPLSPVPDSGAVPQAAAQDLVSPASTASSPVFPHPPIQITTSNTSSGALHMSLTVPVISNTANAPIADRRYSYVAHIEEDDDAGTEVYVRHNRQAPPLKNRVTALTGYAADSLALHLSSHICDLLFLPLEALIVRSVALSFLSAPGPASTASRWKAEVYPLGIWFGRGVGTGRWSGMGDYMGKMVLVSSLELGLGLVVWQAGTGLAWWMGREWFGWGTL